MADEIDLSARSLDVRTIAAVRRYINCSQASATLSSALTIPVHIPVCTIPATTTGTPDVWLEILLPSFGESCPIAQCMDLSGCDGCQFCRIRIGYHIRLCNLGIIPPRKFAVTITKDYLDLANSESDTLIFETDARNCEQNIEPPEVLPALSVAIPYIQSLDEVQMVSDSDVTELYVFTGHRWVRRDDWVLICNHYSNKLRKCVPRRSPPSTVSSASVQGRHSTSEGVGRHDAGASADTEGTGRNPQQQGQQSANPKGCTPNEVEEPGTGAHQIPRSCGILETEVRSHHGGNATAGQQ